VDVIPALVRNRLTPVQRYAARLVVLMLAVSLVGLGLGWAVVAATHTNGVLAADNAIGKALHDRTCDSWLWPAALVLSVPGWPLFLYVMVGSAIVVLLRRRERAAIAYLVVTGLSGGIVDTLVKEGINRRRPQMGGCNVALEGKSFPSGHVMSATISYGMLLLLLLPLARALWLRRAAIAAAVVALLGSVVAREAVGAHYTSDLLAGFVLGLMWLTAATWAFSVFRIETGHRAASLRGGTVPELSDRGRAGPEKSVPHALDHGGTSRNQAG
jgi:undecaprenyl-diphosphatase